MNRKTCTVVLIFLFAAVIFVSGCVQNEKAQSPVNKESPETGKGMKA